MSLEGRGEAEREVETARRRLAEARRRAAAAQSDYFRSLTRDPVEARREYFEAYRAELDAEERLREAESALRPGARPAPRARAAESCS